MSLRQMKYHQLGFNFQICDHFNGVSKLECMAPDYIDNSFRRLCKISKYDQEMPQSHTKNSAYDQEIPQS